MTRNEWTAIACAFALPWLLAAAEGCITAPASPAAPLAIGRVLADPTTGAWCAEVFNNTAGALVLQVEASGQMTAPRTVSAESAATFGGVHPGLPAELTVRVFVCAEKGGTCEPPRLLAIR